MKVYILTDMEGVGGVIQRNQVSAREPGYEKAREWLTHDVNAAVEGAAAGGAAEIVVLDGHGANGACNLVYDRLHPAAQYIQGTPWTHYLQSLDESFDAMFQIGAHAMAGAAGAVLEHTMSSQAWVEMLINDKPTGEIGLCAAVAGHFGVPFVMASGDDKACREAQEISPGVECAVVKQGISRHCAKLLPMPLVHDLICDRARAAIGKAANAKPVVIPPPVEIRIVYFRNDLVDAIKEREGVRKVGPREVVYTGGSVVEAFGRVLGG